MKAIILLTICCVSLSLFGQSDRLKKANKDFDRLAYAYAARNYEKLIGSVEDDAEMKGKLAYSYLKMENFKKAVEYYSQIIELPEVSPEIYYHYSYALKSVGNYAESDIWMNKYSMAMPTDSRSKLFLANKDYKSAIEKLPPFFKLKNSELNSSYTDFGGYFNSAQNKVYFVTSRKKRAMIENEWAWDAKRFLDVFSANLKEDQSVSEVKKVAKINTKFHEGPLCFSSDGKTIYFTRNNIARGKKRRDSKQIQNLKIYYSTLDSKGKWSKEKEFPYNSKEYSVGHPTLSNDGKTMYFVSDKPGGIGGADLYMVSVLDNNNFGEMINMGPQINTEGQEMFPFVDKEGRLFFSTDGHPGLGGLDVFVALKNGDSNTKVSNVGLPINSRFDDFAFSMDAKFQSGFISSNRSGGNGDDIYCVTLIRPFVFGVTIEGTVKDKKGEIVPFAQIEIKDDKGSVVKKFESDENGKFLFETEYDRNFVVEGSKEKYFDGKVATNTFTDDQVVTVDLVMEKDPGLSLYGLVRDSKTDEPIEGVQVYLLDNFSGKAKNITTPASGDFREALFGKKLNDRGSYNLVLKKEGYFSKTVTYNTLFDKPGQYDIHSLVNLKLDPEVKDLSEMVKINPINFDLNKFNIRKDAAVELDKIVEIMNKYPYMVVELGAHTDCRGSVKSNETLSDKRAKASAEYIKKRITNPDRIFGKGYGESRLLNDCGCEGAKTSTCSEEEHALNRRTEFRVISTGDDKLKVEKSSTDSF